MSKKYTPTKWVANRTVATADIMNNIEKGISSSYDRLDNIEHKVFSKDDVNIIYVDSINGDDNNDGSLANPFASSKKAFDYICKLGSKTLFNQWKIKFMPGIYRAVKVSELPQFSKPLIIEGSRDDSGITSIFEYENGTNNYIGIWLEPMKGNSVHVKDLKFIGYKKGFNGYGVIGKNQGYLRILDCEGEDNDCCFAGINNVTLTVTRTIVRNSSYGFRSQYNSACTIGAGTGGSHMSDGGNGCEVYDCNVGFLVTRNSVAHSDYVKYNNCGIGVKADMNTRVATLSNVFNSCETGLKLEGGAEWIGGIDDEVDSWSNCTIPYTLNGNSRCNRVQSLYCKNESLFLCKLENEIPVNSLTGTTEKTEIFRSSPKIESLPEYYLDGELVKVRIVIKGEHKVSSGKSTSISVTLRGLNADDSVNGRNIDIPAISLPVESSVNGSFTLEHDLVFKPTIYQRSSQLLIANTTGGNRITSVTYTYGDKAKTEGKKQLIVYATPNDLNNVLNIKRIEMYLTN